MISAKEARKITDNDIYNKELKEIEEKIKEACNKGCDYITKDGRIHPEVRRKLIELGFEVFYRENGGFYDSEETTIKW